MMTNADTQLLRDLRQLRAKRAADDARTRSRVSSRERSRILSAAAHGYLGRALAHLDAGRPLDKDQAARRSWLASARIVLGWSRFECLSDRQLSRLICCDEVRASARDLSRILRLDRDQVRATPEYQAQLDCFSE